MVFNFQAVDIEDYEELHAFPVRNPDSMYDWEDDDTFARLRLQGEQNQGRGDGAPVGK